MGLTKIDENSILKLCSGQVVLDLASIIKELVENSLDAGASIVEIKFKEFGIKSLEIIDNGCGIPEEDLDCVGLRNHTSKLETYQDFNQLDSLGFRGEALNSIATLAKLTLITATSETAPKGFKLDLSSSLRTKVVCHRMQGTTFKVENLFYNLPVRHHQLLKNSKKEFTRAVALLQAFALTYPDVQLKVSNMDKKNLSNSVFSTHSSGGLLNQFGTIFGAEASKLMLPVDFQLELGTDNRIEISGFISQPANGNGNSTGRSSTDRQFLAINHRICNLPKFAKSINDTFKSYCNNKYPTFVLKLKVRFDRVDVNLTPDKRTVMLHDEPELNREFKVYLIRLFQDWLGLVPVNHLNGATGSTLEPNPEISALQGTARNGLASITDVGSTKEAGTDQLVIPQPPHKTNPLNSYEIQRDSLLQESHELAPEIATRLEGQVTPKKARIDPTPDVSIENKEPIEPTNPNSFPIVLDSNLGQTSAEGEEIQPSNLVANWSWEALQKLYTDAEASEQPDLTVPFETNPKLQVTNLAPVDQPDSLTTFGSISSIQLDSRKDFVRMTVVGQFNLGFLIVKLDSNLYLIDQHAADEIFNYNRFKTSHAHNKSRQPLIQPKPLHFSVSDELVALDHLDLLAQIGYHLEVVVDRQPGNRLNLLSLPTTSAVTLDLHELERILHQLSLHPTTPTLFSPPQPTTPNPQPQDQLPVPNFNPTFSVDLAAKGSQLDAKLASLACRASVMIGDHLDSRGMVNIVHNLATLDHPYNCPHGRPTIRHLCQLE